MNAGEMKEEVRLLERTFVIRGVIALVLLILGAALVATQVFVLKDALNLFTFFGVVLIAIGLVVIRTLWSLSPLYRAISSYEDAWRAHQWTKENLLDNLEMVLPLDEKYLIEYAHDLISLVGVGPYSRGELFTVTHSASAFEERQRLTLGMISLLGQGHLVLVEPSERFVWSPRVKQALFVWDPMPDDWEPPSDPWLYNFATDTVPPRT